MAVSRIALDEKQETKLNEDALKVGKLRTPAMKVPGLLGLMSGERVFCYRSSASAAAGPLHKHNIRGICLQWYDEHSLCDQKP